MTGADQYTVWNTDSSGRYLSHAIGVVSGADYALQALESSFQQDLNNDGRIGLLTTAIETAGSTRLTQAGNHYFLFDSGGAGPSLKSFGGSDYSAGELGAWTPIAAERTASGYEIAWKVTGADQYTV